MLRESIRIIFKKYLTIKKIKVMRLPETDEEMWRMGHWGIIIMIVGTIIRCIYDALKDSC